MGSCSLVRPYPQVCVLCILVLSCVKEFQQRDHLTAIQQRRLLQVKTVCISLSVKTRQTGGRLCWGSARGRATAAGPDSEWRARGCAAGRAVGGPARVSRRGRPARAAGPGPPARAGLRPEDGRAACPRAGPATCRSGGRCRRGGARGRLTVAAWAEGRGTGRCEAESEVGHGVGS